MRYTDIDTYREILDTITRNKARSMLTGFGVFWGVFMLVTLIGGGQGVKELLQKNFDGFATNTVFVFSQPTTKAYKGLRKGRSWNMDDRDIQRLRMRMPELEVVTPMMFGGSAEIVNGGKKCSGDIKGVQPEYEKIQAPKMYYGRFLNNMDMAKRRRVCVIGKKIYKKLFPSGTDPCGKRVKVGNVYYQVVGVDYNSSSVNMGGNAEEAVTIPANVCRQIYGFGNNVHMIAAVGRGDADMKQFEPEMRRVLARAHNLDPADMRAIQIMNTQVLFQIMDNLFKGVNFLIWLVGLGTILAGAIGVSNIMMVTVKERTSEIGIRRAIGATPKTILSQILAESLILTTVAGMSGILFGVAILQMLELANTSDGIVQAHFQIRFWTAIAAASLLALLGTAAGLAPAYRAMTVKPIDAMREE